MKLYADFILMSGSQSRVSKDGPRKEPFEGQAGYGSPALAVTAAPPGQSPASAASFFGATAR